MFAPIVDFRARPRPSHRVRAGAWLSALVSTKTRLAVHPLCVGTLSRDDGWGCVQREVDAHWVLLALDGHSVGMAGGVDIGVQPGDAFWVPPGVPHAVQWSGTFRYAEVYFSIKTAGRHLTWAGLPRVFHGAGDLKRSLDRLAEEVQVGGGHQEQRLRALLSGLCIDLWRIEAADGDEQGQGLSRGQRRIVLETARRRGAASLEPRDLAKALSLSPNYFSRQFRAAFGVSPRAWLNRRRIEEAAVALGQTDLPVYAIADQWGYAGVAQFSRQFKSVMGQSPRDYRQHSHS